VGWRGEPIRSGFDFFRVPKVRDRTGDGGAPGKNQIQTEINLAAMTLKPKADSEWDKLAKSKGKKP
jgi:hypothetical protein